MLQRSENGEVVARYCPSCKTVKPIGEFRRHIRENKWQPYCRSCTRVHVSEWQRAHPRKRIRTHEHHRRKCLKKKYGITLEDYNRMFTEQGGVCCICGEAEAGNPYGVLEVEHNNKTGKVRGLVCHPCNIAISWYESWARYPFSDRVAKYMKRHG